MKTKHYITGTVILWILIALLLLSSCQRKTFCYYQTNEIDLRIETPDKLGHYTGKPINKQGNLEVMWETKNDKK